VVPAAQDIEKLALEQQIVAAIDRNPSHITIDRLHSLHNISKRSITKTYKRCSGRGFSDRRRDEMHCRHPGMPGIGRLRIRV
jgi:DNA-binding MarR family transcriptional regulator